MGGVLEACRQVTGSGFELVWVDPDFLLDHGVEHWTELPLWVPESSEDYGLHDGDVSRALAWGLTIRPIAETVRDTWAWMQQVAASATVPSARPGTGMAPEREAELLGLWSKV